MTVFEELAGQIVALLKADARLSDIRFSAALLPKPANFGGALCAAVGVGPVKILPDALGDAIGEENGAAVSGRRAEISVTVQLYAPVRLGGGACVDAFSRISDSLLFGENGLCLQSISCGRVAYLAAASAFQLEGTIGVTAYLSGGE